MMGFIRPELRAAFWRWREAVGGLVLAVMGLYWGLTAAPVLSVIGGLVALAGSVLIVMGLQRGRFRAKRGDGPGTVDVDEGQVTYFGPLTGGAVALGDLQELALIRSRQTPHWRLSTDEADLFIPVNADGSDALFDAFTVLPGLKVQRMLSALQDSSAQDIVIWTRGPVRPSTLRLH